MAKVKIQGNASGTGILTVTAPNTSTDRTITLPDSTATLATTADVLSSITDNGDATAITIDSSEKVALGGSGSVSSDSQVAIKGGNLELTTAGSKYWIARASDGALTGSLYSPSGSVVRLSGAGTSAGTIEFEPRSSNGVIARVTGDGLCFGSDTAAANALDNYEEGTWTPILGGSGGTSGQAYSIQSGTYTKVGRMCTVSGYLTFTNKGTITSNLQLKSLPFTTANIDANIGAVTLARVEGWSLSSNHTLCLHVGENGTAGTFTSYVGGTSGHSSLTSSEVTNTSSIIFSWTYHTT